MNFFKVTVMYLNLFQKKISLTWLVYIFVFSFVSNSSAHEERLYPIEEAVKQAGRWPIGDKLSTLYRSQEVLFKGYQDANRSNHRVLAKELDELNLKMTLKCELKGAARDAWYEWFSNHLELIYQLKGASETESDKLLSQIETSFENFHKKLQLN